MLFPEMMMKDQTKFWASEDEMEDRMEKMNGWWDMIVHAKHCPTQIQPTTKPRNAEYTLHDKFWTQSLAVS